mmetsp:Transcript_14541/g.31613  ORF Transcript_14541/g.31613 Transcript_14541/m.31613 type:complete len:94 (-) Transcript_14541:1346-1627(-)
MMLHALGTICMNLIKQRKMHSMYKVLTQSVHALAALLFPSQGHRRLLLCRPSVLLPPAGVINAPLVPKGGTIAIVRPVGARSMATILLCDELL